MRGARFNRGHDPALEHPRSKPTPQQLQHPPIAYPPLDLSDQRVVRDFIKTALDVGVKRPHHASVDGRPDHLQGMVGRAPRAKPVAGGQEIGFEDRLQHRLRRRHHHPIGHTRDTERPQLARPTRLRYERPPQRLRPVGPGTQLLGELIEKVTDPGTHNVIDGDPIDTGRPAVSTDLAPSLQHHVSAGDLVVDGMETAILVLLSTAVEHALESTNTIHALGAADGPSRYGTHQVPLILPMHR